TQWAEQVDADEPERFERYAALFTRIQAERSKRWGEGRALHRKQLAVAHGTLDVLDSLPVHAKHGLFAQPRVYETRVRLSNGGLGGPVRLGRMLRTVRRACGGLATETLYSAVPMANGPYAVRVRIVPAASNGAATAGASRDWAADFCARLRRQPLHWDLQLQ